MTSLTLSSGSIVDLSPAADRRIVRSFVRPGSALTAAYATLQVRSRAAGDTLALELIAKGAAVVRTSARGLKVIA